MPGCSGSPARRSRSSAGRIDNHAKSTGRLDIEAVWTEPVDDLAQDCPSTTPTTWARSRAPPTSPTSSWRRPRTAAGSAATTFPRARGPAVHRVRHEFRDTKHRRRHLPGDRHHPLPRVLPARDHRPAGVDHPRGPGSQAVDPQRPPPRPAGDPYVVPTFRWTEETLPAAWLPVCRPTCCSPTGRQPRVTGLRNSRTCCSSGFREGAVKLAAGLSGCPRYCGAPARPGFGCT